MPTALLLGLQAAASAPAVAAPLPSVASPIEIAPIDFDISSLEGGSGIYLGERCAAQDGPVIVVCGRRTPGAGYDFAEMARRYAERPLLAEMDLGGGVTGRAYLEQVTLARGEVSNRVMVGIRLPF